MERGMNKIIIVTRRTRLQDLIRKYNTFEQAKFYIEHLGVDFTDYILEDKNYQSALETVKETAEKYARVQCIERDFISNMIFGKEDIVVAVGQDGLVANVMKYLDGQPLVGINPDTKRWDGVLLPFEAGDLEQILPSIFSRKYNIKEITMAKAEAKDGQVLYAVNDLFIGISNHTSARYSITYNNITENHSSSGIIISTGFGSTGWYKSIMTQMEGMARMFGLSLDKASSIKWDAKELIFTVREPYIGKYTGAEIVFGKLKEGENFHVISQMPENGIIFSDGIECDNIVFNSGMKVSICIAERKGKLVTW